MSVLGAAKVVGSLPGTLVPDTIYAVRTGVGFSLFVSDSTGSVAHPVNVPNVPTVALGRWSGTSVASLTADNVFDDALYSSYIITGQFRPATNAVNFSAVLRSSTPADVGGGMIVGQNFSRMNSSAAGGNNATVLHGSVSSNSTAGITSFRMTLHMRGSTVAHAFALDSTVYQSDNNWYAITAKGLFLDTTPRQGIKFSFSSGNIAEGWFEILGVKKQ